MCVPVANSAAVQGPPHRSTGWTGTRGSTKTDGRRKNQLRMASNRRGSSLVGHFFEKERKCRNPETGTSGRASVDVAGRVAAGRGAPGPTAASRPCRRSPSAPYGARNHGDGPADGRAARPLRRLARGVGSFLGGCHRRTQRGAARCRARHPRSRPTRFPSRVRLMAVAWVLFSSGRPSKFRGGQRNPIEIQSKSMEIQRKPNRY